MDLYDDLPTTKDGTSAASSSTSKSFLTSKTVIMAPPSVLVKRALPKAAKRQQQRLQAAMSTASVGANPNRSGTSAPPPAKRARAAMSMLPPALRKKQSTPKQGSRGKKRTTPPVVKLEGGTSISKSRGKGGDAADLLDSNVENEYDPAHPNDYEKFCEDRLIRRRRARAERELKRQLEDDERERQMRKERNTSAPAFATGLGRGRGRGLTVPAWMKKAQEAKKAAAVREDYELGGGRPGLGAKPAMPAAKGQFESASEGASAAVKREYVAARGLAAGKSGAGFNAMPPPPMLVGAAAGPPPKKKMGGAAIPPPPAFHAAANAHSMGKADVPSSKSSSLGAATSGFANMSRVVMLTNMVGPGEVDDDLQTETSTECSTKYGPVKKCLVYEVKKAGVLPECAVRIFVEFERQASAVKAHIDLNGRFFAGRKVSSSFYDQDRFDRLDLAPAPHT